MKNIRTNKLQCKPLKKPAGFTLIELMITVAIIGILAAVAYPSYTQYIIRANRAAAQSFMMGAANQQAQFLLDTRRYFCTAGCTNVLSASTPPPFVVPTEVSRNYTVAVTTPDETTSMPTFIITATPTDSQLAGDAKCKALTLNQAGAKGISGTGTVAACW